MKAFADCVNSLRLTTDARRGLVFVLLSVVMFGVLLVAQRPHWAVPWLIASLFTFAVWRMGAPPSK